MIKSIKEFDRATWIDFNAQRCVPPIEPPEAWTRIFYKKYPRFPQIKLRGVAIGKLEKLLLNRESKREFSQDPIGFETLSHILQFSAGKRPSNPERRMYPSGGARYPIELYVFAYDIERSVPKGALSFGSEKLEQGIYHHNVKDDTLEQLKREKPPYEEFFGTNIKNPAVVLLMTGVMARSEVKYLENAYKFALIECGHIAQNISLLSQEQGVESCCIGGFDNKKIISYLDLVEEEEIPLYAIALGSTPSKGK